MFQNFRTFSQRSLEAALTLTSSSAYEGEVKKTVLWLALFALIPLFRSRLAMFYGMVFLGFTAGQSLVRFWFPHYAAPGAPLILGLAAIAFRQISLPAGQWRRARLAPFAVAALSIVSVTLPAVREAMNGRPGPAQRVRSLNRDYVDLIAVRDAAIAELDREPGKKLVFVAYDPSFDTQYEWVYNPADLGSATILFVHDLGEERNRQLMRLQSDRVAWIARVRTDQATVTRYVPAD
jgi:hypothetical protein